MPIKIHGAASAQQNLTADLQFYILYCTSPGAYSDPDPNPPEAQEQIRSVNILVTDHIQDQSQKNFEILFQTLALRAAPVIMNNPVAEQSLAAAGAPTLVGEGFMWKFALERGDIWQNFQTGDPVGLLIKDLDGVIIASGVRITTVPGSPSGVPMNMEFIRVSNL